MDIVFLRDKIRYDGGGASRSIHLLAENLVDRGHTVEVITVHFSGRSNNLPKEYSYTVTERPLENDYQLDGAIGTYNLLKKLDSPDIIHCFQPQLHPIVGAWRKRHDECTIVGRLNTYESFCTNHALIGDECYKDCTLRRKWKHHPDPSPSSLPKMAFDTWVQPQFLNEFDHLLAQSPAVKEIYAGYGVNPSKLTVVPNFYDTRIGDPMVESWDKDDSAEYRVIYVGRLAQKKGVHVLLEAFQEADIDGHLDIVGDGPEREALMEQAGESVTVHGWIDYDELGQYYKRADVFVHPGLWPDPCPRSVLEAMQYGCVPVVSDVGGPPWMVGDSGVVFDRGNPQALRAVLERLVCSDTRSCYNNDLPSELDRFAPEKILGLVGSIYQDL